MDCFLKDNGVVYNFTFFFIKNEIHPKQVNNHTSDSFLLPEAKFHSRNQPVKKTPDNYSLKKSKPLYEQKLIQLV